MGEDNRCRRKVRARIRGEAISSALQGATQSRSRGLLILIDLFKLSQSGMAYSSFGEIDG